MAHVTLYSAQLSFVFNLDCLRHRLGPSSLRTLSSGNCLLQEDCCKNWRWYSCRLIQSQWIQCQKYTVAVDTVSELYSGSRYSVRIIHWRWIQCQNYTLAVDTVMMAVGAVADWYSGSVYSVRIIQWQISREYILYFNKYRASGDWL